jgi:GDPmannose 4,6-dehydratase
MTLTSPSARRALVCGVSGQDGAYLSRLLLDKEYEVFGSSRNAQTTSFVNLHKLGIVDEVRKETINPVDFLSVSEALARIRPDEIYNLSGQSSVSLSFQQPVETLESTAIGTLNFLEAIRLSGLNTRFYNSASGECFGDTGTQAANESAPFRPLSPYAAAKAAAFWEVAIYRESYGLYACSGIPFNHESPLRSEKFVTRKIVAAATRIAHGSTAVLELGNLNIRRDWGWAPDYVEAMWRMLQQQSAEDFVIATGVTFSLEEFLNCAFSHFDLDWHKHVRTSEKLSRPADISEMRADATKARQKLGWTAPHRMPEVAEMMLAAEESAIERPSALI